jgi:GT2 family glycosyltransferase
VRERASWVLVIHADMVVAEGTREALAAATSAYPSCVAGALGHRIDDRRLVFRLIEAGNRLRARSLDLPYGDQAQFWKVTALEASNGFPQLDQYEDLELALRLRRLGKVIYVDHPVTIPARHWDGGVVRATLRNWQIAMRFAFRGKTDNGP